jgi:hypothetical protein
MYRSATGILSYFSICLQFPMLEAIYRNGWTSPLYRNIRSPLTKIESSSQVTYKHQPSIEDRPSFPIQILTISCKASLLYGIIHSFGEYPTALAAAPMAHDDSATTFRRFFIVSCESQNQVQRITPCQKQCASMSSNNPLPPSTQMTQSTTTPMHLASISSELPNGR